MPQGRSSRRRASLTASSPNLDAAYGPTSGSAIFPPIELTFTIRPFASRMFGMNAWITATWPTRLTSSWWRSSSSGRYSIGPLTATPALLTSPLRPRSSSCLFAASIVSRVGDVELHRGEAFAAEALEVGVLAGGGEHVPARALQPPRGRLTDPRRCPRHQHGLGHAVTLPR